MSTVSGFDPASIARAADLLRGGGLVAFPTETVYGLGADATSSSAIARVFEVKGRPATHPLIVHLGDGAWLEAWTRDVPDAARRLAECFWPGPLTLILHASDRVSPSVTGGQATVGVRVPRHPVALALLRSFGSAIAAPSANRFGRISPTTAAHVEVDLGSDVDLVLDGGPCDVGIESTIVDVTGEELAILRPGHVTAAQIAAVTGRPVGAAGPASPRAPGTLEAHYAPRTPLWLVSPEDLRRRPAEGVRIAVLAFSRPSWAAAGDIVRIAPDDAARYAHDVYAVLRELDHAGVDRILVQAPPDDASWRAVTDRLRRAARGV